MPPAPPPKRESAETEGEGLQWWRWALVLRDGVCSLHFGGDREPRVVWTWGWFNLKAQRQVLVSKSRTSPNITHEPVLCRPPFHGRGEGDVRVCISTSSQVLLMKGSASGGGVGGSPCSLSGRRRAGRRQGLQGASGPVGLTHFPLSCASWSPQSRDECQVGAVFLFFFLLLPPVHSRSYSCFVQRKHQEGNALSWSCASSVGGHLGEAHRTEARLLQEARPDRLA